MLHLLWSTVVLNCWLFLPCVLFRIYSYACFILARWGLRNFLVTSEIWLDFYGHSTQWCIAKNGGGYTQRGVAKGLKVPCLFMITEVSIRCPKKTRRLVYGVYPRIPPNTPLTVHPCCYVNRIPTDKPSRQSWSVWGIRPWFGINVARQTGHRKWYTQLLFLFVLNLRRVE